MLAQTTNLNQKQIHVQEKALVALVSINLICLSWGFGGMQPTTQITSVAISIACMVFSLLPRRYVDAHGEQFPNFTLHTWPKLIKFPIFWMGLIFLIYCTIQAVNPSFLYKSDLFKWWLVPIPHVDWLPTSVKAPFSNMSSARTIIIYLSAYLTICSVYTGVTRRRSITILLTVISINSFLLAALGISERALQTPKILFLYTPPASYFVSTFIYKNHAGAYFNLMCFLSAGLAYWHYQRALRHYAKSSPSLLFAFFAMANATVVLISYSRTSIIILILSISISIIMFLLSQFTKPRKNSFEGFVVPTVVIACGFFILLGVNSLNLDTSWEGLQNLATKDYDSSVTTRSVAARATLDLAKEKILTGWGPGSFRYIFPKIQQRIPELTISHGQRLYWEHAHNDYFELLSEFGLIGVLPLIASGIWLMMVCIRLQFWSHPIGLVSVIAAILTCMHSAIDFQLYNPCILITLLTITVSAIRWMELETRATFD